jgi:2-dehydro-3-deoxyphosphogluconate aldolase/(4S)-4-hydroxy-2-oxoglutarate aldolase
MTTAVTRHPLSAEDLKRHLASERLVPVLRATSGDELRRQLDAASAAGLRILEITATSPGWAGLLAEVASDPSYEASTIAAGTITTRADADAAIAAGAEFLVAPYPVPDVRSHVAGRAVLIEGGLTPGELAAASHSSGIAKLFPAATVGIGHLRAVRDVLPDRSFMPTGGITLASASEWLAAGAIAVGMGGGLLQLPSAEISDFRARLQAEFPASD